MYRCKYLFFSLFLIFCSFSTPEGIRYLHWTNDIPQAIHILEVDPKKFHIAAARALDKCIGREDVLSLSQRKGAVAGINGGFFSIGGNHDGAPCGILKVDGVWYGLPIKPRGALGWSESDKTVLFDRVLTHQEGIDFKLDPQCEPERALEWDLMKHVVGGVPLLIHHGVKIEDYTEERSLDSFFTLRHARTAVGRLPNGHWIFVVVDGKQSDWSVGMTIKELASLMEDLGCIEALNLDGGGSSTLVLDNEVINKPAGDGDAHDDNVRTIRAVSDAILIFPRQDQED